MYNTEFVVLVLKRHLRVHTQFEDELANKLLLDGLKNNSCKTVRDRVIRWSVEPHVIARLLDQCYDIIVKKHDPVLAKISNDLQNIVEMDGYTVHRAQYTTLFHKLKHNDFSYAESNNIQIRVIYYNGKSYAGSNYPYVLPAPPVVKAIPAPAPIPASHNVVQRVLQPAQQPVQRSLPVPLPAAVPNKKKTQSSCVIQ